MRLSSNFHSIIFTAQVSLLIVMAGILAWRLAIWQTETGQRPDDLLTTFPIILLLVLVWPGHDRSLTPRPPLRKHPLGLLKSILRLRSGCGFQERGSNLLPSPENCFSFSGEGSGVRLSSNISRALTGVGLSFMLLVLIASPFQGGVQWGPRFLLPGIVPLTVGVIAYLAKSWRAFERPRRIGLGAALIALLVVGGYSTWNGVRFIRDGQAGNVALQNLIAAAPEQVVVTDAWFIPQGAPYSFENKIWLMAEDEEAMFALLQLLRKTTNEPGILYISSLTWAHVDPQILMGPRIAQNGDFQYFDWPGMYLQVGRYYLNK